MMPLARRLLDGLWGSGDAAVTLPPMDGALRPNRRLEEALVLAEAPAPDNLAKAGPEVVFSSGTRLFALDPASGEATSVHTFPEAITCIAGHPDGGFAVGMAGGGIAFRGGALDGRTLPAYGEGASFGPTALAFDGGRTLLACIGSARNGPDDWKRDLMGREASGSVLAFDLAGGGAPRLLAGGLAFPNGLVVADDGAVVVSEAWRHRLVSIPGTGKPMVVLDDLPGYPARLARSADGSGYWLAVFAPRTQLIEFILREPRYRLRMMREVDPRYWMAPSMDPPQSFLEPLQGGAVKQLGILKPWAPSRSCGLVVRLDRGFQPMSSLHSRADGRRHGITSCLDCGDALLATSRGGNVVIAVPAAAEGSAS